VSETFVDTDVIIRLLTGDDPAKQASAAALFEQVESGTLDLTAPDTVVADAVFVLSSPRLHRRSRPEVAALFARGMAPRPFSTLRRQRRIGRG
jgi:predicted nucleic acid-binding protein